MAQPFLVSSAPLLFRTGLKRLLGAGTLHFSGFVNQTNLNMLRDNLHIKIKKLHGIYLRIHYLTIRRNLLHGIVIKMYFDDKLIN